MSIATLGDIMLYVNIDMYKQNERQWMDHISLVKILNTLYHRNHRADCGTHDAWSDDSDGTSTICSW